MHTIFDKLRVEVIAKMFFLVTYANQEGSRNLTGFQIHVHVFETRDTTAQFQENIVDN